MKDLFETLGNALNPKNNNLMSRNIKVVYTPDVWEAYCHDSDLPIHSESTFEDLKMWATSNGFSISQIDDSQID